MSEFEFMRSLPFGQVVPGTSPLHRLDARARIVLFTALIIAVVAAQHPLGLLLALALGLGGVRLARLSLRYTLRALWAPLPLLLILSALQLFFNAAPDVVPWLPPSLGSGVLFEWGIVRITPGDVLAAVMLLLRFGALVVLISLASQVLSTSELAHGLVALATPLERIGVPVQDAVMALVVAVRFLPFLAQAAERIAKAQAARGTALSQAARKRGIPIISALLARARALLPLLVPIFVTSLRRAEVMALAMDARGYASRAEPTSLVELRFTGRDALGLLVGMGLVALIMIL